MTTPSTSFDAVLAGVSALDESVLGRPWSFRDKPMEARYALYRALEEAQEALVLAAARPHPESRRILALAQRAFGDLRGLLAGMPDEVLDRPPAEGQWPIRETLRHVLAVGRRYAAQTLHAVRRADDDPVRLPGGLPEAPAVDVAGGIGEILGRIADARAEANRQLGDVPPARMTRPAVWVHYDVDVRFRLHRFAAHLAEHTVQCEKILTALGRHPTEGRRIARHLAATLGEVEGLDGAAAAREIQARLAERVASIKAQRS
jgi:hypothetical protein